MSSTRSTGKSVTQGQGSSVCSRSTNDEVHNNFYFFESNEGHNIDVEFNDLEFDSFGNKKGKRKLTSKVWESYSREKVNGVWTAICKNCKNRLSAKTSSGTSHLRGHLDRCPQKKFHDAGHMLFNQDISQRELVKMVILHEYPLSMVEHSGFHRFVGSIQPMFKIPSRNTFKSDILKIYDYERVKTMALLERNKGRIALTTEMWTCNNQRKEFMVIKTHFVDNSWTLQSRIIRFVHVQCSHTSEMLADVMMNCLLEWNIEQKVFALTMDNCSTITAMIPIILEKLSSNSLLLSGDMFHMRCSAHILNLIVKHGLDVVNDSIERIRGSVSYWTASPKREEKFLETVHQLNIESTKKLVLDCKTRWNSTYFMIRSALIYKTVFLHLKQRDSQYKCVPTEDDWVLVKEISDKLEVFYLATEQFLGTKYPTVNSYLPMVCEIGCVINEWSTSTVEETRRMASSMSQKFDSYWSEFHGVMVVATILDPRFKMKAMECYFPTIYGDKTSNEIKKIHDLLLRMIKEYEGKSKASQTSSVSSSGDPTHVSSSQSTMVSSRTRLNHLSLFDQYISLASSKTNMKTELESYLEEPIIPRTDNFDILGWWNVNALKYPTLHCIARDILAIPVSTVASELTFSTGGRYVDPHRSRLHPKTLEALMCAQDWLWYEFKDSSMESKFGASTFDDDDDDGGGDDGDGDGDGDDDDDDYC